MILKNWIILSLLCYAPALLAETPAPLPAAVAEKMAQQHELPPTVIQVLADLINHNKVPVLQKDTSLRQLARWHKALLHDVEALAAPSRALQETKGKAVFAIKQGHYAQALAALTTLQQAANEAPLLAAAAAAAQGQIKLLQFAYADAAQAYQQAHALLPPSIQATRAFYLNEAGHAWFLAKNNAQAKPLLEQALAQRIALHGAQHRDVATTHYNLSLLYAAEGQVDAATQAGQKALTLRQQMYPAHHSRIQDVVAHLATVAYTQQDYATAQQRYQQLLQQRQATFGQQHPEVAAVYQHLAQVAIAQDDYATASQHLEAGLKIQEITLGGLHPQVLVNFRKLADLYQRQKQFDKAMPLYKHALALEERLLGPIHPRVLADFTHLAGLYYQQENYAEAQPLLTHLLNVYEQYKLPEDATFAHLLNNLATAYVKLQQTDQAEPLFQRALTVNTAVFGANHVNVAENAYNLALFYLDQQRHAQAKPLLEQALAIYQQHADTPQESIGFVHYRLGLVAEVAQDYPTAKQHYKKAMFLVPDRHQHFHPEGQTPAEHNAVPHTHDPSANPREGIVARYVKLLQLLGEEE